MNVERPVPSQEEVPRGHRTTYGCLSIVRALIVLSVSALIIGAVFGAIQGILFSIGLYDIHGLISFALAMVSYYLIAYPLAYLVSLVVAQNLVTDTLVGIAMGLYMAATAAVSAGHWFLVSLIAYSEIMDYGLAGCPYLCPLPILASYAFLVADRSELNPAMQEALDLLLLMWGLGSAYLCYKLARVGLAATEAASKRKALIVGALIQAYMQKATEKNGQPPTTTGSTT